MLLKKKKSTTNSLNWTFLSNHAHILLCLYRDPSMRMRDIAELVGITERAVIRIIEDLDLAGIITKEKSGRRNQYKIKDTVPLRHKLESHKTIGELLKLLK